MTFTTDCFPMTLNVKEAELQLQAVKEEIAKCDNQHDLDTLNHMLRKAERELEMQKERAEWRKARAK